MPGPPIEAVIFDYGGVISPSPFTRLTQAEQAFGLPSGTLTELFGYGIDTVEPSPGQRPTNKWHLLELGAISLDEYVDWVRQRSVAVFGQPLDLGPRFQEGIDTLGIHWMVVQAVRRLRQDGYKLAICTNNIAAFRSLWRQYIPIDWFHVVVDSSEVGVRKPDPAIYHLTCELLDVGPDRCVFLDDHPGNVAAATALGMAGVVVGDPWVALDHLDGLLRARGPSAVARSAPGS